MSIEKLIHNTFDETTLIFVLELNFFVFVDRLRTNFLEDKYKNKEEQTQIRDNLKRGVIKTNPK